MELVAKRGKVEYEIVIETANACVGSARNDNLLIIELTGQNGTVTGPIQLNEIGDENFCRGNIDGFLKSAVDVGLPILVRLELRDIEGKNPLGVRRVKVWYRGRKVVFPVHDWVENELNVVTGEAVPYHKVHNPHVMAVLQREVKYARELLRWVPRPGPTDSKANLPRFVDVHMVSEIPLIFRPTEQWTLSLEHNPVHANVAKAVDLLKMTKAELNSLESYHVLYKVFEEPGERSEFLDRWRSDEEYGRQQLNGIAPMALERCSNIPETSQISDVHVKTLLGGKTLTGEMKAGKVYMTDFTTIIRDVKRNKQQQGQQMYCPDSICLYHVNCSGDLFPVAIQLVPGDPDTIFTPENSELDWLLAKMYHKVAFGCVHEWYHHFLLTHGVMEPVAVAMFRSLPRSHPIYKLMKPHLQTITVINVFGRADLLASGSGANSAMALGGDETSREMFKTFDMNDLNFPELMKKRGLNDPKLLPKFYFRDDATRLWEIIEHFAATVIRHYYPSDEDIVADRFLQDMMEDLATDGLGWEDEKHRKGLPYPLRTVDQLILLCTSVIFTSSVHHSAVNFPQYDQYKYIPNSPLAMRLPPHKKGEATMERIMNSLPDMSMSLAAVATTSSLSSYAPDEILLLGDYPVKLFVEKEAKAAMRTFRRQLDKYRADVKKRNNEVPYPYEWLLPEKIAASISI